MKQKKHCKKCGEQFEGAANKLYCTLKCRNQFNQWKWLDKQMVKVTPPVAV